MITKHLFAFSLMACLLCFDTSSGLSFHSLTAPIVTAFLVSWPTSYIPRRLRGVAQLIIGELLIVVCLVDAYCQGFFATPITPQILSNVLLSDVRESIEFFSTFVDFRMMAHWRLSVLLLLAAALPFVAFFWRMPIVDNKVVNRLGMVVLGVCVICEIPTTYRYAQLFHQHKDVQRMEGLIFRHYHEEVPTPLHRFVFAYYSLKQSAHVLDDMKHSTFSAQLDSCSYLSPHIVMVIGESYNKHHSTLYGYELPTTPLQQKRLDGGELFVFNDVVTPWNITSNVFLDIFSVWEYGMADAIGELPLFPMLFRRAGYSVNFFSNQYLLKGFRKGSTNQAGHFFLADGEMSDSLFTYRNGKSRKFDMGLVEQVEDFRKEHRHSKYTLDIIHLIGQHFDYAQRYPMSEKRLTEDDYADRSLDDEAKAIIMHYDNATHYNDIVLDKIIAIYEQEDVIMLFVADHGEEVYDDLQVHGRLFQEPTSVQARYEFEVPMWIWCSESYRQNHPDVVRHIEQSVNKPFMTDRLPQVLLSLAGISCQWNAETRNLLSPKYQSRPRTISGTVDFDKLMNE